MATKASAFTVRDWQVQVVSKRFTEHFLSYFVMQRVHKETRELFSYKRREHNFHRGRDHLRS